MLSHLIKNNRNHNCRKTENPDYKIFLINQRGSHLLLLLNLTATNAAMSFACSEEYLRWIINQIKALNLYPWELHPGETEMDYFYNCVAAREDNKLDQRLYFEELS